MVKSCARAEATIAPQRARARPKIISEMSSNLITYFSYCVVGSAQALTAPF